MPFTIQSICKSVLQRWKCKHKTSEYLSKISGKIQHVEESVGDEFVTDQVPLAVDDALMVTQQML